MATYKWAMLLSWRRAQRKNRFDSNQNEIICPYKCWLENHQLCHRIHFFSFLIKNSTQCVRRIHIDHFPTWIGWYGVSCRKDFPTVYRLWTVLDFKVNVSFLHNIVIVHRWRGAYVIMNVCVCLCVCVYLCGYCGKSALRNLIHFHPNKYANRPNLADRTIVFAIFRIDMDGPKRWPKFGHPTWKWSVQQHQRCPLHWTLDSGCHPGSIWKHLIWMVQRMPMASNRQQLISNP